MIPNPMYFRVTGVVIELYSNDMRYERYLDDIFAIDFPSRRAMTINDYSLSKSRTVPLMTNLRTSCIKGRCDSEVNEQSDSFDVLLINMCSVYGRDKSLVVIDEQWLSKDVIPSYYIAFTMTELKKNIRKHMLSLSMNEVMIDIKWAESRVLHLWSHPCALYAQTQYDTDYRKEWIGGKLVYEGNNYGDTSTFLIIGILEHGY